jgi:hypothetical protein
MGMGRPECDQIINGFKSETATIARDNERFEFEKKSKTTRKNVIVNSPTNVA